MGSRNQFKREEDWLVYQSNERIRLRQRMKDIYDINKEHGTCTKCGDDCDINPHTNKPYHECFKHRLTESIRSKNRNGRNLEITRQVSISKLG